MMLLMFNYLFDYAYFDLIDNVMLIAELVINCVMCHSISWMDESIIKSNNGVSYMWFSVSLLQYFTVGTYEGRMDINWFKSMENSLS
jgi:hypothetical protein